MKLQWTTDKPRESGYYWYDKLWGSPIIIWLDIERGVVIRESEKIFCNISDMDGKFYGKLEPPEIN